jgi:hypothetical protein
MKHGLIKPGNGHEKRKKAQKVGHHRNGLPFCGFLCFSWPILFFQLLFRLPPKQVRIRRVIVGLSFLLELLHAGLLAGFLTESFGFFVLFVENCAEFFQLGKVASVLEVVLMALGQFFGGHSLRLSCR